MSETVDSRNPQTFYHQTLSLLTPYFRRYRLRIAAGFVALLAVDSFQLWTPRFIKKAVDALEKGTATESLLLYCAGCILLLALGIALCRFLWRYLIIGFSRLLERDLRDRLMSHLLTLDKGFYQHHTTGELMALTSNDLAAVQLATGMGLVACVDALVMTVAALAFMAYINPLLTLIAVTPMPVLAFSTRFLSARLHKRFKKVQEQFSKLTETARSTLSSMHLVKAYTQEDRQVEKFDRIGEEYIRNNLKVAVVQGLLFPFSGLIANSCLLLVLFFGGRLTIEQTITVGDFVAFVSYLFMLTWPMMAIGWVTNLFQRGATSLGRIQAILEAEPLLQDTISSSRELAGHGTVVSLQNLFFTYPGQTEPALHDVSITIKPGLTGVVGKTGSGKTTLCSILTRLYPVADAVYLLGGTDVNSLSLADVRSSIAYVPQESSLFSETIAFNIALGREDATMAEIEAVARAAFIHDEIMDLEQGYQTRIGEKGVRLSGGQRQRVALARALLLDRPLIIIDDGLSAVDMETEYAIIRSIAPYIKDRSCLFVSHRVAPLIQAREILVMDQGRIVARGDHETLLSNSPFYATIYKHQTLVQQREG